MISFHRSNDRSASFCASTMPLAATNPSIAGTAFRAAAKSFGDRRGIAQVEAHRWGTNFGAKNCKGFARAVEADQADTLRRQHARGGRANSSCRAEDADDRVVARK